MKMRQNKEQYSGYINKKKRTIAMAMNEVIFYGVLAKIEKWNRIWFDLINTTIIQTKTSV